MNLVVLAADYQPAFAESNPSLWPMMSQLMFSTNRMNWTMERLEKMSESEYSIFMRVLFGLTSPSPVAKDLSSDPEFGKIEWVDPTLNDSQKDAIRFALASREIALIHGPPGVR